MKPKKTIAKVSIEVQDDKNDREKVFIAVSEYWRKRHGRDIPFIPGVTPVKYASRVFDDLELVNAVDSILSFWLTADKYAERFEGELARFIGCRYCYMTNSGSSSNLLAFMALTSPLLERKALRRGDEVITSALCFPTTVAPVIQYGAIPVFIDVELETANIGTCGIEEAVGNKTKALVAAHTLGNPFDAGKIKKICKKHSLWFIEDNCDSLGAKCGNGMTGSFGHIGTSSFYPAHHITSGEGGAVYTNDPILAKILMSLRDWGKDCHCPPGRDNICGRRFSRRFGKMPEGYDHKYIYSHLGYNLKATEMQAAIACGQMSKLVSFIERRNRNHSMLKEMIGKEGLTEDFIIQENPRGTEASWFGFMMTIRDGSYLDRNDMSRFLESAKIQTRNLFGGNITRQPCFMALKKGKDYRISGSLKNTDKIMRDSLWVGIYPGQTEEKIRYIVLKIKEYTEKCKRTKRFKTSRG